MFDSWKDVIVVFMVLSIFALVIFVVDDSITQQNEIEKIQIMMERVGG